MWYLIYNALLLIASPLIVVILLSKKRCRRGLPQRLGLAGGSFGCSGLSRLFGFAGPDKLNKLDKPDQPEKPDKPDGPAQPVIWVHAVSLGEVMAVTPLVKTLHQRYPDHRFVVSTVTETGREAVEQRLAGVAEHVYAPLDFPWTVSRTVSRLHPALYVFVETELWPNLLRYLRRCGVPTVLVNGRLSTRSFARQQWRVVRSFYRAMLNQVSLCLMQSERDVERIIALGADRERVRRTGNMKFDQPMPVTSNSLAIRTGLGLQAGDRLFVAGSTHQGEEEVLVECYRKLLPRHPSARLILAPRHIERVHQIEAMVQARGFVAQRRSAGGSVISSASTGARVIILDSRGELATLYREAVVAFVGGTLVPIGGHNLLEPALWGRPVLFGPYTDHCWEIADLLIQAGAGRRVAAEDLPQLVLRLFDQPKECERMGRAAQAVVHQNQGALRATVEAIESMLASIRSSQTALLSRTPVPLMAGP